MSKKTDEIIDNHIEKLEVGIKKAEEKYKKLYEIFSSVREELDHFGIWIGNGNQLYSCPVIGDCNQSFDLKHISKEDYKAFLATQGKKIIEGEANSEHS